MQVNDGKSGDTSTGTSENQIPEQPSNTQSEQTGIPEKGEELFEGAPPTSPKEEEPQQISTAE